MNNNGFLPLFHETVLNNPSVPELNAWCDMYQAGLKHGLHNTAQWLDPILSITLYNSHQRGKNDTTLPITN